MPNILTSKRIARYANVFTVKSSTKLGLYAATFLVTLFIATAAWSHSQNPDSGITLKTEQVQSEQVQSEQAQSEQAQSVTTFPLKGIGGDFELIDYNGKRVTHKSYQGRHLLVFFGYINCKSMCSLSLARIGKALTLLGDSVNKLAPLVITVDPERDTPEAMKTALHRFHPRLIGLTGTPDMLKTAYQNYKQHPTAMGNDDNNNPIISHSSYIYLMNKNGKFATLFPPILNPQNMAKIIRKYIDNAS